MNNFKEDENYVYAETHDDHFMLEGETEADVLKRMNDRTKAILGDEYDTIRESEAYKLILGGLSFDELLEEMGLEPREQDSSDVSK